MKLYQFDPAPASRRVDIFLKEADVSIATEQLNVRDGDQFKEPFNSLNPFHCVPFLELSDGTVISETLAICRYLEESNQGKINLFGSTPKDRASIEMWNRRLEIDGYIPLMAGIRNKFERFDGKVLAGTRNDLKRSDIIVKRGEDSARILFERLDKYLDKYLFVAGKEFSVADITLFSTLELANNIGLNLDEYVNILDLKTRLSERDAFKK
tara:strand:- start:9053 stop:9685 length:633 start_codon:yes stop_codon:yes gene_type:complete